MFRYLLYDIVPYWVPPAVWAAGIFCMSHTPAAFFESTMEGRTLHLDIVYHLAVYTVFSILLLRASRKHFTLSRGVSASLAMSGAAFYAVTDELHQHFVEGRYPTFMDFFLDTGGAGLGLILYFLFLYLKTFVSSGHKA